MEIILVCLVAFAASMLTFFSGYGLGTLLLPVFSLFFPLETAIAMTAVVHLLNNLFKIMLVGKAVDKGVLLRFGIPSMIASFAGALLLSRLVLSAPLFYYEQAGRQYAIEPVKIIVGVILLFFALLEWFPKLLKVWEGRGINLVGGLVSGFFGGLTGNQGALRSAFLIRAGLTKEAFIATGVMIACLVDVARLFVYSGRMASLKSTDNYQWMILASLAAFCGAFLGNKLLKKITLRSLQLLVTMLLIIYAFFLMAGVI